MLKAWRYQKLRNTLHDLTVDLDLVLSMDKAQLILQIATDGLKPQTLCLNNIIRCCLTI